MDNSSLCCITATNSSLQSAPFVILAGENLDLLALYSAVTESLMEQGILTDVDFFAIFDSLSEKYFI